MHYSPLTGWLQDPDSRPPFTDLGIKFDEFLLDPRRYILTMVRGQEISQDTLSAYVIKSQSISQQFLKTLHWHACLTEFKVTTQWFVYTCTVP